MTPEPVLVDYPVDKLDLRSVARDFLGRHCSPDFARECDEKERFPHELFAQMAALGWQGIPFGAEVGGSEGDPIDEAIVVEQMGRAMGPLASAFVISVMTCGKTVRDLGTAEQRQRLLPPIIAGTSMMAYALTEPGAGSDAAAITTRAVVRDGGWLLNGQKIFCTGASLADHLLVMARTGDGSAKRSISMFVVPTHAAGVTINTIPKLGLHPYPSCMIFFDNVVVPDADLLGEPGAGWPHLVSSLNRERLAISAMCTGMAWAALDTAVAYARERRQFGRTITSFDAVREHIADMAIAVEGARALMLRAARLEADGRPSTLAASVAKMLTTDAAVDAARLGMQVMGGYSYTMEYPMQRFLRDALIHPIAGGSNEIQRNIIAGELLAADAPTAAATLARADDTGLRHHVRRLAETAVSGLPGALGMLAEMITGAAGGGGVPAVGATAAVLPPAEELGLATARARVHRGDDGWTVTGTAVLIGAPAAETAVALIPMAEGEGALLLHLDISRVTSRSLGRAASSLTFDSVVFERAQVQAPVTAFACQESQDVLAIGATAILVALADAAREHVVEVMRRQPTESNDRWAGQSLKHRVADGFARGQVAWLEMHRAIDSTQPAARSLHAAVGLHEALLAARQMATECTRVSAADGDADGSELAAATVDAVATVDLLVGGPYRLKARVAGIVLGDAPNRRS